MVLSGLNIYIAKTFTKRKGGKKIQQIGVRLTPEAKARWEQLARDYFHKEPSALARSVLEEFMACFVTDDELAEIGLVGLAGHRPGALLSLALKRTEKPGADGYAGARISDETKEILFVALRSILEWAPEAIIEDTVRRLTALAGKYGESKLQSPQKAGTKK